MAFSPGWMLGLGFGLERDLAKNNKYEEITVSAHARESRAMKPFACLSFCSTVYRKKRDCSLSNVLWGSSRVSALREANRRPVDFVYFLFFREFDHNDL